MIRTVAAFDFDGTLTRRDSVLPFLASVAGWPAVARALGPEARTLRADRDVAKERVLVRVLGGRPHDELAAAGSAFAETLRVTDEMQRRVEWHRREGHEIVIVSASLDLYLRDVARRIGIAHVLCTTVEARDGICTGQLVEGNCRGPAKAARLTTFLQGDTVRLWAYGDSRGDDEMLALADHPVRVRRGRLRDRRLAPSAGSGPTGSGSAGSGWA